MYYFNVYLSLNVFFTFNNKAFKKVKKRKKKITHTQQN